MRPLRLDIAGFAAFRDPIAVDFTDADYFALTGPTGSGKSTVIDAMTFALYGSAPRWGRENAIQYALAPTANRCTIRLVFDVADQRYVVAREVRRSGKSITQKNPRLERYLDPAATGDPDSDEPTESLAADARSVRQQVAELLGLDFDDFCTCVVLPQGDFATFLKASVAERQTILLKLLGARHYETIGRLANRRAADASARIDALQGQLKGYADATEEAEAAARDRHHQLAALAASVTTSAAELSDLQAARTATAAAIDWLVAQLGLLTAVEVPAGIDALQEELAAADQAYTDADRAEQQARDASAAAEGELLAGPQRGPLEETLRWHTERTQKSARLPQVSQSAEQTAAVLCEARTATEVADRVLEQARADHERCRAVEEDAASAVTGVERQLTLLRSVTLPAGTTDLDRATEAARAAVERETERLGSAEKVARAAADAVAALPERSAITALERAVERYSTTLAQRDEIDRQLQQTTTELTSAEAATVRARAEWDRALAELEQLRTQSVAADLRPHLVVGAACPVCDQSVATLPAPLSVPALDAARAAVEKADRLHRGAVETEETLRHRRTSLATQEQTLAEQLNDLDQNLTAELSAPVVARATAGADSSATAVVVLRAHVDDALRTQQAALREQEAVRRALQDAQLAAEQAADQAADSWAKLHAKHGQLSDLDPPPVTVTGLAEAWDALVNWAGVQRAQLTTHDLAAVQQTRQTANADLQAAAERLQHAADAARQANQHHTTAAVAESKARTEHTNLVAAVTELENLLAERLSEADARRALAEHQRLEKAATEARSRAQLAARDRQSAEAERDRWRGKRDAARSTLHRVREPLVPLGVPTVDDTDLSSAWAGILSWARGQAAAHERTLGEHRADLDATDTDVTNRLSELADQLESHDLTIATPTLDQFSGAAGLARLRRIPTEVELAAERAAAATTEIRRRRSEAADLRSTIAADTEIEQVSRQLARMMSAKQFPQWLADAALDTLVADASASLLALSSGQFELTHEKGEFFVIDHTDADSARSVKTLSGGETFQASLALALALSEQLSTLAAGGRTTLDSIFLDEGFGTLDPDALEIVASTLENLAQGRRMVGVVTHVAALAERVPVRYLVSRDSRTSTIERVGP